MNPLQESCAETLDEHRVSVLELTVCADAAGMPVSAIAAGIEALSTVLREPEIRVVVLALRGTEAAPYGAPASAAQVDALHDWLLALWDSDKPVVAALEADIGGATLALALACDLVVACGEARLRLPPRLQHGGRTAAAAWLAAQRLPAGAAAALALGCELDAVRAHAMGLVVELAPAGLARERALALAQRLATEPPEVLASVLAEGRRARARQGSSDLPQVLAAERARCLRGTA